MEFGLSKEQELLQDSVGRLLDRIASLERVKRFVSGNEARAADVWAGLCDLGIPGMLIDEHLGGIGLGLLDAALVAETLGSRVAPAPFIATLAMVPIAIAQEGSEAQRSRWLPALAQGSIVAGAAVTEAVGSRHGARVHSARSRLDGRALFVLDFEADVYLVADQRRALYLVEAGAAGLKRQALTTIDKTRRVGELVFDNVVGDLLPGSSDPEVCARVIDAGRIMLVADTLGAAQVMLTRAVEYSKGACSSAARLVRSRQ